MPLLHLVVFRRAHGQRVVGGSCGGDNNLVEFTHDGFPGVFGRRTYSERAREPAKTLFGDAGAAFQTFHDKVAVRDGMLVDDERGRVELNAKPPLTAAKSPTSDARHRGGYFERSEFAVEEAAVGYLGDAVADDQRGQVAARPEGATTALHASGQRELLDAVAPEGFLANLLQAGR